MKTLAHCLLTLGLAILPLSVPQSASSSSDDDAYLFVEIETVVHRASKPVVTTRKSDDGTSRM